MALTLTKFNHSCLLVQEDGGQNALFDPGEFSLEFKDTLLDSLDNLDELIITHEHFDHFSVEFVRAITTKFPQVHITAPQPVVSQLADSGVYEVTPESSESITVFTAPHEDVPFGDGPPNIGVHFKDLLTHPGDSHSFHETKLILAMPMTAPWGSMTGATKKILELKPKYVLPIHDWHWRPDLLASIYGFLKPQFEAAGVELLVPEDGQPINITVI